VPSLRVSNPYDKQFYANRSRYQLLKVVKVNADMMHVMTGYGKKLAKRLPSTRLFPSAAQGGPDDPDQEGGQAGNPILDNDGN